MLLKQVLDSVNVARQAFGAEVIDELEMGSIGSWDSPLCNSLRVNNRSIKVVDIFLSSKDERLILTDQESHAKVIGEAWGVEYRKAKKRYLYHEIILPDHLSEFMKRFKKGEFSWLDSESGWSVQFPQRTGVYLFYGVIWGISYKPDYHVLYAERLKDGRIVYTKGGYIQTKKAMKGLWHNFSDRPQIPSDEQMRGVL